MPTFNCPKDVTSVSVGGEQFNADEHGGVDVPDHLVSQLPHDFARVSDAELAKRAESKAIAEKEKAAAAEATRLQEVAAEQAKADELKRAADAELAKAKAADAELAKQSETDKSKAK